MIRLNRGRVIGLLLTGFIVYFLFLSSANTNSDFRKRTEEGLSRRHGVLQGDISDEAYRAQTNQRLNDILAQQGQKPLGAADEETKAPPPQAPKVAPKPKIEDDKSSENTDEKYIEGVAGRKTMQKGIKEKPKYPVTKTEEKEKPKSPKPKPKDDGDDDEDPTQKESSDPAKDIARRKLQEYLRKPLIIFSKSYCPHSKRAKHLLLNIYKITPTPLVVELDQLTEKLPSPPSSNDDDPDSEERPSPTLGQKLQELLAEISGRRTVPNILVGTTSIGGNDLIWEMHEEGTLAEKIRELGGKRITAVEVVGDDDDDKTSGGKGHR